ncbi:hypothetical protein [Saccharomonospora sp. CUA-673]|uniref:hypothetical protein n=1 Tax=Saccharomonospora sp. CUA-673 TaxID=1904969 RepID=UPI00210116C1|nr:hypothetical protein [Saccharomonospora sp. CUA-673]
MDCLDRTVAGLNPRTLTGTDRADGDEIGTRPDIDVTLEARMGSVEVQRVG